jgi:hypothetical protein
MRKIGSYYLSIYIKKEKCVYRHTYRCSILLDVRIYQIEKSEPAASQQLASSFFFSFKIYIREYNGDDSTKGKNPILAYSIAYIGLYRYSFGLIYHHHTYIGTLLRNNAHSY